MKMIYSRHMKMPFQGYEITEEDIAAVMRHFITSGKTKATREDAIAFLEEKQAIAHLGAHKIVEDERSGKIKPVNLKKL
jgi:hypothetical protein